MKRLVAFLLLSGLGCVQAQLSGTAQLVPSSSTDSYSTTFPLTENPISEGSKWLNGGADGLDWSNVQTDGIKAFGTQVYTGNFNDSVALLKGNWGPDQTVQGTLTVRNSPTDFPEAELWLRGFISAHSITGYEVTFGVSSGAYCGITRWNGPLNQFTEHIETSCTLPRALQTGDVLKASISGSTITIYVNGAEVGRGTDTTYTTGAPGLGFFHELSNGNDSAWGFADFSASDSSTAQAAPMLSPAGTYTRAQTVTMHSALPANGFSNGRREVVWALFSTQ